MGELTAFYIRETSLQIKVATDHGRELWIKKYMVQRYRVSDCDVHFVLKPRYQCVAEHFAPAPKATKRNCLGCRRHFMARSLFRFCDPCKDRDAWKYCNQSFDW